MRLLILPKAASIAITNAVLRKCVVSVWLIVRRTGYRPIPLHPYQLRWDHRQASKNHGPKPFGIATDKVILMLVGTNPPRYRISSMHNHRRGFSRLCCQQSGSPATGEYSFRRCSFFELRVFAPVADRQSAVAGRTRGRACYGTAGSGGKLRLTPGAPAERIGL
jgi:hypothetical protein